MKPNLVAILAGEALVTVLAFALTILCWLLWFPEQGRYEDPYQGWRILGLGLCVVVAAAVSGWFGRGLWVVPAMTAGMVVVFSVQESTRYSVTASLWPVGAAFLWAGASTGLGAVALIAYLARVRREIANSDEQRIEGTLGR
jgi:hypothetical protein